MRILIATGGAPHSDKAVRLGGYVAEAIGASVTLLTVVKNEARRAQGEAILERAATLLPKAINLEKKLRAGHAAGEIVREARERNVDMLVLGQSVRRGLPRRILAPVLERVLDRLPCPVLVAQGRIRRPERILLCEGGRAPSLLDRLVAQLNPLPADAETVIVLHVMSQMAAGPGVRAWELNAGAEELIQEATPVGKVLKQDLEQLEQMQVERRAKVRHGLVVKEVLNEARSGDYDLIVIGANQGSRWQRFLVEDVARLIVRYAGRPVLVL